MLDFKNQYFSSEPWQDLQTKGKYGVVITPEPGDFGLWISLSRTREACTSPADGLLCHSTEGSYTEPIRPG